MQSNEKNELSYENEKGEIIYTSQFLKNRGTCCRTNCLHCPYGFTLKNFHIELSQINDKQIKFANEIIRDSKPVEQSELSSMLLAGAFGKKDKIRIHEVTKTNVINYLFGLFKGEVCAVIELSNKLSESTRETSNPLLNGRNIENLYLKKEFQNQGLETHHIKQA